MTSSLSNSKKIILGGIKMNTLTALFENEIETFNNGSEALPPANGPINTIILGDALSVLKTLPNELVDCIVTSPPYYNLRDYDVEDQLGRENTPEEYIDKLVAVFHEAHRTLSNSGTLWLNLGDTMSKKQLLGIPWRVALALQSDGWNLIQDIIWAKPNPMPESVKKRCTKSHEHIFLLSKSNDYYFDNESIKEPAKTVSTNDSFKPNSEKDKLSAFKTCATGASSNNRTNRIYEYHNKRDVWTVAVHSFREAHFATFPEKLILPCVLAGSPKGGLVYDPFMGAATTAVVAIKNDRNYLGSELNPVYIKIANNRIRNLSLNKKNEIKIKGEK
jgi:site-specific DNA-methyltransferase (adenine-specific)